MYLDNQDFISWMERLSQKLSDIGKDIKSMTNTNNVFADDDKLLDNQDLAFLLKVSYRTLQRYRTSNAIKEFERIRGQLLTTEFTDPWVRLAIMITCLLVSDISIINDKANLTLRCMPPSLYRFIIGIANSISEKRNDNF